MSAKTYHWCHMQNGNTHTCGYIESRGAKLNARVELTDMPQEGLWTVTKVGAMASKAEVNENARKAKSFGALEHTTKVERRVGA